MMMAMMIKAKETEILSQNATLRQTHRRNYGQKSHINRNCYQSRRVVCLLKLHECDRRTDGLACNQLICWSGQRPFLPLSVSLSPSLWNSQHNSGITRKDLAASGCWKNKPKLAAAILQGTTTVWYAGEKWGMKSWPLSKLPAADVDDDGKKMHIFTYKPHFAAKSDANERVFALLVLWDFLVSRIFWLKMAFLFPKCASANILVSKYLKANKNVQIWRFEMDG